MARPVTKQFKRITISLPKKLVEKLNLLTAYSNTSDFIANAITEKLAQQQIQLNQEWFKDYNNKYPNLIDTSAVELLQSDRNRDA